MKYILPCLLVLLLILIFYPNDYDEVDTTIYIGNNKYYAVNDRHSIYYDPGTVAVNSGGKTGNYSVRDTGEWIMPVNNDEDFYITSLIGYRILRGITPKYHRGFDISNGKYGSDVLSIGAGSVVDVKPDPNNSSNYGICLTIRYHSESIGNFCVIYSHLDSYDKELSIGSAVLKGQVIGQVGNTGESTGPHLHWQLFYGVKYADLNNSFNPFQVLYPVENTAGSITAAYGMKFNDISSGYNSEKRFYASYEADKSRHQSLYDENERLGVLFHDFFK